MANSLQLILRLLLICLTALYTSTGANNLLSNKMLLPSYTHSGDFDNIAFGCIVKIHLNVTKCNEGNGFYIYNSGDTNDLCNWLWSNIVCSKLIAKVTLFS